MVLHLVVGPGLGPGLGFRLVSTVVALLRPRITLESVIGPEGSLFLSLDSAHALHSVRNRPEISDVGPGGSGVFGL